MTPVEGTPGWFDDPTTPGITRYWDGKGWTDRSFGEPLPQGPPAGYGAPPPQQHARQGLFGGPGFAGDSPYPPGFVPSDKRPPRPDAITDGWAITSLVLGIIPCFWGIPAIIYGGKAKNRIRYSGGARKGEGLATAGQILGWCWVVINVASIIIFMVNGAGEPDPTYGPPPTTYR
jgi:hypothetical protein